jgi:hypothetical protein
MCVVPDLRHDEQLVPRRTAGKWSVDGFADAGLVAVDRGAVHEPVARPQGAGDCLCDLLRAVAIGAEGADADGGNGST